MITKGIKIANKTVSVTHINISLIPKEVYAKESNTFTHIPKTIARETALSGNHANIIIGTVKNILPIILTFRFKFCVNGDKIRYKTIIL